MRIVRTSVNAGRCDLQRHNIERDPLNNLAKWPFEHSATAHNQLWFPATKAATCRTEQTETRKGKRRRGGGRKNRLKKKKDQIVGMALFIVCVRIEWKARKSNRPNSDWPKKKGDVPRGGKVVAVVVRCNSGSRRLRTTGNS